MQEKPEIQEKIILTCLWEEYGLAVDRLEFLPWGADVNTAVYRAVANGKTDYFIKLRKGDFSEISVSLPHFLNANGIQAVIPPLETRDHRLWVNLEPFRLILQPYVEGRNGYEVQPSTAQWIEFGQALKQIHSLSLPAALVSRIPSETFSSAWREMVLDFLQQVEVKHFSEPTSAKLAVFMKEHGAVIRRIVMRANQLGEWISSRPLKFVLCHSDIHPGNLLICPDNQIYIVDWDSPILAPPERDLQLIGGCPTWNQPDEITSFRLGYGDSKPDPTLLAYYRYERVIQDMAAFCQQILLTGTGGKDRQQGYQYFCSNFLPGHEIDLAHEVDRLSGRKQP